MTNMTHYNNLAEKAAEAEKRRETTRRRAILLPIALILMVAAPVLMFINNAGYNRAMIIPGIVAVIVEMAIVALALYGAWYNNKTNKNLNTRDRITLILVAVAILFLIFVIIGFRNDTFHKGQWRRSEDGVYYKQVDGGVAVMGIDKSATDVTIAGEYDYFPVTAIRLSINRRNSPDTLVINLGTAESIKLSFRNVESLRSLTFVGGELVLGKRVFKNCSLQSVSFKDCVVEIWQKAFKRSYIVSLNLENTTAYVTQYSFARTGVADLYAEGSTISAFSAYEKFPILPFKKGVLNRVSLKDSTMKNIHVNIGTMVLDGVCNVELDKSYVDTGNRYSEDLFVRSLVLKEGFDGEASDVRYVWNQYKRKTVTSTTYYPFSLHIYVPAELTALPNALFGDTPVSGAVTVHYGGSEADWQGVTVGSTNNSLFASAVVRYNETSEYWAK